MMVLALSPANFLIFSSAVSRSSLSSFGAHRVTVLPFLLTSLMKTVRVLKNSSFLLRLALSKDVMALAEGEKVFSSTSVPSAMIVLITSCTLSLSVPTTSKCTLSILSVEGDWSATAAAAGAAVADLVKVMEIFDFFSSRFLT